MTFNKLDIEKLDTAMGLCLICKQRQDCPMKHSLPIHRKNVEMYGEDYSTKRPDLWDQEAIDEPDIFNNEVIWCPEFSQTARRLSNE